LIPTTFTKAPARNFFRNLLFVTSALASVHFSGMPNNHKDPEMSNPAPGSGSHPITGIADRRIIAVSRELSQYAT
jgi:hypothetical protein